MHSTFTSTLIPEKSKINQKSGLFFHHPLNDESDKQKGKSDLKNVPTAREERQKGQQTKCLLFEHKC